MISFRDALGFGRRGAAGEDAYPEETVGGAVYRTSRVQQDDITLVVKRFPRRTPPVEPVETGTRQPGSPMTFVLVHGLGVSSRYFHPLAAELARHGEVYLVDLPGYGAAPNPRRDVTLADHAGVVARFIAESGIRDPVLVGHSMGTQIVSLVARDRPDLTDRLVLLAPTMQPGARTGGRATARLLHDALREPPRVFGIAVTDYLVRCGLPYLLKQLPHMLDDRMEDRMPALESRVLVIDGDRDPIVSNDWTRELARMAVRAEARIVRGPHVIMHTDPVTTAEHIVGWAA